MSTINILIPVHLPEWWRDVAVARYAKHACAGTRVIGTMPGSENPTPAHNALASVLVSQVAALPATERVDAHILDCFGDPAIGELSSQLGGPVVGVGYAGLVYGYSRFAQFAVITSEHSVLDEIRSLARAYGVSARLRAVDAVGISAADTPGRADEAFEALRTKAERLPKDVEGIVLGCTELAEFAAPLERALREAGRARVRTVNPIAVAIRWAEMELAVRAASAPPA